MAQRSSSDGINADGELTPSTRKTALEAMRNVLQRTEFTPRARAEEDGFGMEAEVEDDVAWSFLESQFLRSSDPRTVEHSGKRFGPGRTAR